MQIKDIYFIKTILDRATAGSYNGQSGYYSVSDNMFSEGHSCYCDNGNDYYSDLKGIFNCATTDFSCPGFNQANLENGNYNMTIVKLAGVDHLTLLIGGVTINLNFDGNYYYTQNNYSSYGGTLYRFDYVNGEIEYVKTYSGGSYAIVSENVETTLFSSASIMMYYSGADRNINYATIRSEQGIGSGGWQVPNPNPTRKIVVNGSEPDDIKLNGATPKKIMLNGQCYYEAPEPEPTYLYKWDFTKSLTDEVGNVTATLGNASFTEGTGVTGNGYIKLGNYIHSCIGKTYEIDFASFEKTNTDRLSRVLGINSNSFLGYDDQVGYICKKNNSQKTYMTTSNIVSFTNKTLKLVFVSDNSLQVYLDDTLLYEGDTFAYNTNPGVEFYIGNSAGSSVHAMETFTVTGVCIYENEE